MRSRACREAVTGTPSPVAEQHGDDVPHPPEDPATHPPEDPDIREEVQRVQEGYKDAGPSTGVVTHELRDASEAGGS
jgi:hypothetical protein